MKYSDINFDVTQSNTYEIKCGDAVITVKDVAPTKKISAIIDDIVKKSCDNGICDETKKDAYFWLGLTSLYTDLEIDEDLDELEVYDNLDRQGFFYELEENLPVVVVTDFAEAVDSQIGQYLAASLSITGIISGLFSDLPQKADEVNELLDSFDINKFQNVMGMAKNLGMPLSE